MAPDYSSVIISPSSITELGEHTVNIELVEESGLKLPKTFNVTVMHGAPYFAEIPLPNYKVALNDVKLITMSEIFDLDQLPITMTI